MSAAGRPLGPRGVFLDATETYLRAILELEEERGIAPRRTWLRDRLQIGRASIDQYVQRLSREGLVTLAADHRVELTEDGRRAAARVMRKHRLAERLLVDVVGFDWSLAHGEANRWQHVLGDDVERRLVGMLDRPWVSPYGNPIPALTELVPDLPASAFATPAQSVGCDELARRGGGTVLLEQLSEGVQADCELLARLHREGLLPGAAVEVGPAAGLAGPVTIRAVQLDEAVPGAAVQIDQVPARGILVVPMPLGG